MSSDPRKRALELARRRAKQRKEREKLLHKDKESKVTIKKKKVEETTQESYLEKVRKREEQKKQAERDRLQREMEKLALQQKVAKKQEVEKKKREEKERKEKIEKLEQEKIKREKEQEAEIERENQFKEAFYRKKNKEDRLKRESEYLKKSTKSEITEIKEKPIGKQKIHKTAKKPKKSSKKITRNIKSYKTNKEIPKSDALLNLKLQVSTPIKLYQTNTSIFQPISLHETRDFQKRQDFESKFLNQSHYSSKQEKSLEKLGYQQIFSLWNSQVENSYIEPKIPKTEQEEMHEIADLFRSKFKTGNQIWLPLSSFNDFKTVLIALSSKLQIQQPKELQILTDLENQKISQALIDGIHLNLIEPIFGTQKSIKNLPKWKKELSKIYYPICGFKNADSFYQNSTPIALDKYILERFLEFDLIREFLHGLLMRDEEYPINSRMFEQSIHKLYSNIKIEQGEKHLKAILDFAHHLRLISISRARKYKSGSSKFVKITTFGKQKIQNFKKRKIQKPETQIKFNKIHSLKGDSKCPTCDYPIITSFDICPNCGEVLTRVCRNCGRTIKNTWNSCPYCGLTKISSTIPLK